jgi:hypothetical protein
LHLAVLRPAATELATQAVVGVKDHLGGDGCRDRCHQQRRQSRRETLTRRREDLDLTQKLVVGVAISGEGARSPRSAVLVLGSHPDHR